MYVILDLDDVCNVVVGVNNDTGNTALFSNWEEAIEYAESHFPVYQIVELEEN